MRLFMLYFCVVPVILAGKSPENAEDCCVYEIENSSLRNISSYFKLDQTVEIGFLHTGSDHFFDGVIQIFIHLPPNYEKKVEIFINQWKNITLSYKMGAERISKTEGLPIYADRLIWIYLAIRITRERADRPALLVNVSGPGEITQKVHMRINLDTPDSSLFRYQVASSQKQHVAFNCLTGCPVFSGISSQSKALSIKAKHPFYIHLPRMGREGEFSYAVSLESESAKPVNITGKQSTPSNEEAVFEASLNQVQKRTEFVAFWNDKEIYHNRNLNNIKWIHYSFWSKTDNIWTLNCKRPQIKGKSLSGGMIPYRNPRVLKTLPAETTESGGIKIGEIVAWVVALVAICGVIIMATTVYKTVTTSAQPCINAPSHMDPEHGYGDHYALQLAEFRPQVSFKRKPAEESSEPRHSVIDSNALMPKDHFYPLKICTDDELSIDNEDLTTHPNRRTSLSRETIDSGKSTMRR